MLKAGLWNYEAERRARHSCRGFSEQRCRDPEPPLPAGMGDSPPTPVLKAGAQLETSGKL